MTARLDTIVTLCGSRKAAKEKVAFRYVKSGGIKYKATFIGAAIQAIKELPEGTKIRITGFQTEHKSASNGKMIPYYTVSGVKTGQDVLDYFDFD